MGEVRTCVILLFVLMHVIHAQSYFDSFICDFLCGDDDMFGLCEDCSSEESSESTSTKKPTSSEPLTPTQNISIKIPASEGTSLDILNWNGLWSVSVDAQSKPSASSAPPAEASTTPKSTAASESTTGASTTAAARR
ncbi:uncharacterized protein LOC111003795 [Pieris rapae]|uniref:uncharacterized protein LOC111003795 n=1 Tax=Pieris rapae TaxID=64459 RepID=UPI000B92CB91|nr:uncharacterized protein LOC111003795 [Pieris rapae]